MITNKSIAIRLGKVKNWSAQASTIDSNHYQFSNKFGEFINTFFSDSIFRDRGIAYSHSITSYAPRVILLQTFLQDAKICDFIGTFSRRPLFAYRYRMASRYGKGYRQARHFSKPRRFTSIVHKFRFKKRFLFSNPFRFYSLSALNSARRIFHSFYTIKFSRLRRARRYINRYEKSHFMGFYNYFFSKNSYRLAYYSFIARMLAKLFFSYCQYPISISYNHIVPRQSTAALYLNYICTKLYYRYILNDVVNPIVRLSLRQYRGFSINCKGRFTRAQIATQKNYRKGSLSFSYIKNHLDYCQKAVTLKYGTCNLKLWIRR